MEERAALTVMRAARSVRSVAPAMPMRGEMGSELRVAQDAARRGYFFPDEDEQVREVFARYLSVRAVLLEVVGSIEPVMMELEASEDDDWALRLQAFVVGFAAATMLVRAASFMVDLAADRPVVWKKLDEAEPRYGIPEKSFTRVYKGLSSSRRMWRFHEAIMFYEMHHEDVTAFSDDPVVGELVRLLRDEAPFLEYRKRDYLKRKWNYRLHSFRRRHVSGYKKVMFHLLKLSGSAIAEMRQPFIKGLGQGHRVTNEVIASVEPMLRAGDVFVTRHDDAMSNLFLPGFWPHAALYLGSQHEWDDLGLQSQGVGPQGGRFLEAKKDGVMFRPIRETLEVDAFMVLRPKLEAEQLAEALMRAISHEGKLYDFMFDFRKADRLACTEVVYRSYHGIGPVSFELERHSGRSCLSAEDLIAQALGSGQFVKIADYGVDEDIIRVF
ncbi:MAG: hypothetical protein KJO21_09205 [Verrucomicrobiae bacterium]|nr:hypothetical protein [Verrucomicrobiae bacterium]NNJ43655.1 hypothetical protein [Akkermansiaceae bacterium]